LICPFIKSAFYYKQDKKGKRTWLKEKPASGPHRGWDPNKSRHWYFPEEKTEALFRFIVRHYSQPPSDKSLLCRIKSQVRLGTYTLHHTACELARQYFKSLKTLQHPLLLWYFLHFAFLK